MRRLWLLVVLWLGASVPAAAQAAAPGNPLQIFLLTMGPGDEIYTRFGHNAVLVRDTVAHRDLVYNYGTFGFDEGILKFVWNFAVGRPRYWLNVVDLDETMQEYRDQRRSLVAQELNLTPAQRQDIARRLAVNALPENRTYTYDYFRDNCSTRVRDLLDAVLGGALKQATRDHLTAHGYRYHTMRSLDNQRLLMVGIDAAFGAPADRSIDQWEEMFLPAKLHDRVAELRVPGIESGTTMPLVKQEMPFLTPNIYHVESAPPSWLRWLPAGGVTLALVILLALRRGAVGVVGRVVGTGWLLIAGVAGLMLIFFWLVSDQVFTYHNANLFFLNPLAFLLIPLLWRPAPAVRSRWRDGLCALIMVLVAVGGGLLALDLPGHQDAVIGLTAMLPTLFAAAVASRRPVPDLGFSVSSS